MRRNTANARFSSMWPRHCKLKAALRTTGRIQAAAASSATLRSAVQVSRHPVFTV